MGIALTLLAIVLLAYALILWAVAWVSLHPIRVPLFLSPGLLGTPQENVEFPSPDGLPLRGWWVDAGPGAPVVVLAHGYVMNRCEFAFLAQRLWQMGFSCLLFDFRAHGRSGGRTSTLGLKEALDAEAAIAYCRVRCPETPVLYVGSSMGAAAGVFATAAGRETPDALVLDGAYRTLAEASKGWWNYLAGPVVSVLLRPVPKLAAWMSGIDPHRMDVEEALASIDPPLPTLVLANRQDTLVPPASVQRIASAARTAEPVEWFEGDHGQGRFSDPHRYTDTILRFLTQVVREPSVH